MRKQLDEQLESLNVELIKMGALCEDAIAVAMKAMLENESKLIEKVFHIDSEIDRMEKDIEHICMRLLLQQQPVARDLRQISSALKMISDMERIGDQAADIAEIVPYVIGNNATRVPDIGKMAKEVIRMTNESIDSFVKKDLALAQKVINDDDIVDKYFSDIKIELINLVKEDNKHGECYMDLLMISKYLERIGDHATNIAEWVEYTITGHHESRELQDKYEQE